MQTQRYKIQNKHTNTILQKFFQFDLIIKKDYAKEKKGGRKINNRKKDPVDGMRNIFILAVIVLALVAMLCKT